MLFDGGENLHQMAEPVWHIIHQLKIPADNGAKITDGKERNDGPFQVLAENMALHQDEAQRPEAECILCR